LNESPDDPGNIRPCLVVQIIKREDEDGTQFVTLMLCYGTSQHTPASLKRDLFIGSSEYRALGLHNPTRFSVERVREFIWGTKWFPPHPYIVNRGVRFGGPLNEAQIARFKDCWKRHHGADTSA
jgi:hypothetical protein